MKNKIYKSGEVSPSSVNEDDAASSQISYQKVGNGHWLLKKVIWTAIWISCSAIMTLYIYSTFSEFTEDNPITIVTFVDLPENLGPIVIKVCNKNFFDDNKIVKYNGTEFDPKSVNFLKQMVLGNTSFDIKNWILTSSYGDTFLLSPRILNAFKLDIDKFLIACLVLGEFSDCSTRFQLHLDFYTLCYLAKIDLAGLGTNRGVTLGFYFDPGQKFGRYQGVQGVQIAIHHPDDHLSPLEGFALNGNEDVIVSASVERKIQRKSLAKAKCTQQKHLMHNFSGVSHLLGYNQRLCNDMCFSAAFFRNCSCYFNDALNITDNNCLEEEQNRECLVKGFYNWEEITANEKKTLY